MHLNAHRFAVGIGCFDDGVFRREALDRLVLVRGVRLPTELAVSEHLNANILLHPEGVQDGLVLDGAQLLERQAARLEGLSCDEQSFRAH